MKIGQRGVTFVKVSSISLSEFIEQADQRVIIAKPGYTIKEVEVLEYLVKSKGINCTVFIDPAENLVRWGFGEKDALQRLYKDITDLNVRTVKHLRLSIAVVDDQALVFTPVALSWEDEPHEITYPNGILCSADIAQSFIDQLTQPKELSKQDKNVIFLPWCSVPPKAEMDVAKELKNTIQKLEENPPIDPKRLRKVTIYRNNYKLLRIEKKGISLKSRSVNLNPINSILGRTTERLKASWIVFSEDDVKKLWQFGVFKDKIDKIIDRYTLDMKRFGFLIKVQDLPKLKKEIEVEKDKLLTALKARTQEEAEKADAEYIRSSKTADMDFDQVKTLGKLLKESRNSLKKYFKDIFTTNPKAKEKIFKQNEAVSRLVKDKRIREDEAVDSILEDLISKKLRFPDPDKFLDSVDILIDPYDISDELLYENEDFKGFLRSLRDGENEIKIRKFSEAFEIAMENSK